MTRINNVRKTTKFKRSIKAISPVIATLLMIAIAVVASLVVYAWVSGYMGFQTNKAGKAIQIPSFALNTNEAGVVTGMAVYVQNVGQGTVQIGPVYIENDLKVDFTDSNTQVTEGNTVELTVPGTYNKDTIYHIKVTTTDGTSMTTTGKPGTGTNPSVNPPTPSVVVSSFAITAPADATDGSVNTGSSFTVKAMIHVSSGSVSVSATPTFPAGYTGAAAVSHTVGTTDVEFSWTITAPASASASAAVTLSATATGYASDTDNTFNVETVVPAVPQLDVFNTASTAGASSYTVSLTTTSANDTVYIAVATGGSRTASISGFTQRGTQSVGMGTTLQTVYAVKTTAGAATYTITLSGSTASSVVAFAVKGANTVSPFDVTNPSGTTGYSTTPSTTISTTNKDFILGAVAVSGSPVTLTPGSGNTAIGSVTTVNPEAGAEYRTVTTAQTNLAIGYTLGSQQGWYLIVDAIKAP